MALNLGTIKGLKKFARGSRQSGSSRKKIQEIFVHSVNPSPNDWGGASSWPVTILTQTDACFFIVKLPEDFTTLLEAVIVILPDATETIQWDIEVEAANVGERENAKLNNDLNVTQDVVTEIITELNLLKSTAGNPNGLFPSFLKANDYIGIWFQSDTNNIQVMGLRLKFK